MPSNMHIEKMRELAAAHENGLARPSDYADMVAAFLAFDREASAAAREFREHFEAGEYDWDYPGRGASLAALIVGEE